MQLISNQDNYVIFNQYTKDIVATQVSGGKVLPSKYILLNATASSITTNSINIIDSQSSQEDTNNKFWELFGNDLEGFSWYADDINLQSYDEKSNYTLSEIFIHVPGSLDAYSYGLGKDNIKTGIIKTLKSSTFTKNIKYIFTFYNIYDAYGNKVCEDLPMGVCILYNVINYSGNPLAFRLYNTFDNNSNTLTIDNVNSDINEDIIDALQLLGDSASKMVEVTKAIADKIEMNRDIYSMIKNQRSNVPYVKIVDNQPYWFVNGKRVATVSEIPIISTSDIDEVWK